MTSRFGGFGAVMAAALLLLFSSPATAGISLAPWLASRLSSDQAASASGTAAPAPTAVGLVTIALQAEQPDGEPGDEPDETMDENEEPDENYGYEEEAVVQYGWFVGPMFLFFHFDSGAFAPMTTDRGLEALQENTFLWGLMGGVIRGDYRFGALFLAGGHARKDTVDGDVRTARINFYGGGAFIEYNRVLRTISDIEYPARIPFFHQGYLLGLMAGMGRLELRATGGDLGPLEEWQVQEQVLVVYPYAGLWISPITEYFWVQLDVGYLYIMLNTDQPQFTNAGIKMVSGDFSGGIQVGLKITLGEYPEMTNLTGP